MTPVQSQYVLFHSTILENKTLTPSLRGSGTWRGSRRLFRPKLCFYHLFFGCYHQAPGCIHGQPSFEYHTYECGSRALWPNSIHVRDFIPEPVYEANKLFMRSPNIDYWSPNSIYLTYQNGLTSLNLSVRLSDTCPSSCSHHVLAFPRVQHHFPGWWYYRRQWSSLVGCLRYQSKRRCSCSCLLSHWKPTY